MSIVRRSDTVSIDVPKHVILREVVHALRAHALSLPASHPAHTDFCKLRARAEKALSDTEKENSNV